MPQAAKRSDHKIAISVAIIGAVGVICAAALGAFTGSKPKEVLVALEPKSSPSPIPSPAPKPSPESVSITVTPKPLVNLNGVHVPPGDKEFHGSPSFTLNVRIEIENNSVFAFVSANWAETKGDFTHFSATSKQEVFNAATHGTGWSIQKINGKPATSGVVQYSYSNTIVGDTPIKSQGDGVLVESIVVQGDTYGGAFGGDDHPFVTIEFSPLQVTLEKQ